MILTVEKLYLLRLTLTRFLKFLENERNLPIRDAHAIARNLKLLDVEYEIIEQSKNKIIDKYATSKNNQGVPNIPNEKMKDYNREFLALMNTEVEVNLMTFDFSLFRFLPILSPMDIRSVKCIVTDFDEHLLDTKPVTVLYAQLAESRFFFERCIVLDFKFHAAMKLFQIIDTTDPYQNMIESHRLALLDKYMKGLPDIDQCKTGEEKQKVYEARRQFTTDFIEYLSQKVEINIPTFTFDEFEDLSLKLTPFELYNIDYIIEK